MTIPAAADAPELLVEFDLLPEDNLPVLSETFRVRAKAIGLEHPVSNRLLLLSDVCSLAIDAENVDEPFSALFRGPEGSLSFAPADLTDEALAFLAALLPARKPVQLQARIGDLLWVRSRSGKGALAAADAYLRAPAVESSSDTLRWEITRVLRGFHLLKILGKKALLLENLDRYRDFLTERLKCSDSADTCRLADAVLSFGSSAKASGYRPLLDAATASAEQREAEGDFQWARMLWSVARKCAALQSDARTENEISRRSGETYVREADRQAETLQGWFIRANFLSHAVLALRAIPGSDARATELHARMLVAQQKAASMMPRVPLGSVDVSPLVEQGRGLVRGKSLAAAVHALAGQRFYSSIGALRQIVAWSLREAPIQRGMPVFNTNERGEVVNWMQSLGSNTQEDEKIVRPHMVRDTSRLNGFSAISIEHARLQMIEDDTLNDQATLGIFQELVAASSFCAEDRKPLVVRGLLAGLKGDFVLSTHLLIPQVEEAVRHILRNKGVIISGLREDEIQLQFSLGKTLRMPDLVEVLGEDLTFDLESLLVHPAGPNLRNNVAHGLLSAEQFEGSGRYLWWLVLHLVDSLKYKPVS